MPSSYLCYRRGCLPRNDEHWQQSVHPHHRGVRGCSSGKKKEGEASLEDKIVQTNPVLEAWGNAKTVRNDISSRFGKFIRIHFNSAGKLSGADMVVYLLEKSRLTYQQPLERCYHSFYNLMSDHVPDLKEKCLLSNDIYDYWYVSQGKTTVPSIDDKEDMMFPNEAFDVLGFSYGIERTFRLMVTKLLLIRL